MRAAPISVPTMLISCNFAKSNAFSKGTTTFTRATKCLDVSTGWVYISRDVVFDENIFPFSLLHPNAGACLRSEISLLPPDLLPSDQGGELMGDHMLNSHNNASANEFVGGNLDSDGAGNGVDGAFSPSTEGNADSVPESTSRLMQDPISPRTCTAPVASGLSGAGTSPTAPSRSAARSGAPVEEESGVAMSPPPAQATTSSPTQT